MVITNPIQVSIEAEVGRQPEFILKLSLLPDALGLRIRFRALILHYDVLREPIVWDLGSDIPLCISVPCGAPPMRLVTTIYGIRKDGVIELLFRNWECPDEPLLS